MTEPDESSSASEDSSEELRLSTALERLQLSLVEGTEPDCSALAEEFSVEQAELEQALLALRSVRDEAPRRKKLPELEEPQAPPTPPSPPGYRLDRFVGRGGMGMVYRTFPNNGGPARAIKYLPASLRLQPNFLRRFQAEADALASVEHVSIVRVHEIGEVEGFPYLIMDYVEGRTLDRLIGGRRLPEDEIIKLLRPIVSAVATMHEQGLLHRDIKAGNVLVRDVDQATFLSDFGLVRSVDDELGLTSTGALLGTPETMSPEQIRGESLDTRSDVYSLGALIYHALTGKPPHRRSSTALTLHAVLHQQPAKPRNFDLGISRQLENIALTALEKNPKNRYADAGEVLDEFERLASRRPLKSDARMHRRLSSLIPRKPWSLGSTLFVLLVVGLWWHRLQEAPELRDRQLATAHALCAEREWSAACHLFEAAHNDFRDPELDDVVSWAEALGQAARQNRLGGMAETYGSQMDEQLRNLDLAESRSDWMSRKIRGTAGRALLDRVESAVSRLRFEHFLSWRMRGMTSGDVHDPFDNASQAWAADPDFIPMLFLPFSMEMMDATIIADEPGAEHVISIVQCLSHGEAMPRLTRLSTENPGVFRRMAAIMLRPTPKGEFSDRWRIIGVLESLLSSEDLEVLTSAIRADATIEDADELIARFERAVLANERRRLVLESFLSGDSDSPRFLQLSVFERNEGFFLERFLHQHRQPFEEEQLQIEFQFTAPPFVENRDEQLRSEGYAENLTIELRPSTKRQHKGWFHLRRSGMEGGHSFSPLVKDCMLAQGRVFGDFTGSKLTLGRVVGAQEPHPSTLKAWTQLLSRDLELVDSALAAIDTSETDLLPNSLVSASNVDLLWAISPELAPPRSLPENLKRCGIPQPHSMAVEAAMANRHDQEAHRSLYGASATPRAMRQLIAERVLARRPPPHAELKSILQASRGFSLSPTPTVKPKQSQGLLEPLGRVHDKTLFTICMLLTAGVASALSLLNRRGKGPIIATVAIASGWIAFAIGTLSVNRAPSLPHAHLGLIFTAIGVCSLELRLLKRLSWRGPLLLLLGLVPLAPKSEFETTATVNATIAALNLGLYALALMGIASLAARVADLELPCPKLGGRWWVASGLISFIFFICALLPGGGLREPGLSIGIAIAWLAISFFMLNRRRPMRERPHPSPRWLLLALVAWPIQTLASPFVTEDLESLWPIVAAFAVASLWSATRPLRLLLASPNREKTPSADSPNPSGAAA